MSDPTDKTVEMVWQVVTEPNYLHLPIGLNELVAGICSGHLRDKPEQKLWGITFSLRHKEDREAEFGSKTKRKYDSRDELAILSFPDEDWCINVYCAMMKKTPEEVAKMRAELEEAK